MNKLKFYDEWLHEGIQKSGDSYEFDWMNDTEDDLINLKFKKYKGRTLTLGDTKYSYYYAYQMEKSDKSTDLLKAVKYIENTISPNDLDQFVNKSIIGFDNIFGTNNFNAIVSPTSSSIILRKVVEKLKNKGGVPELFTDAFVKAASTDIKLDMDKVNNMPEKTKKDILRAYDKATEPGKPFKIRDIYSSYRYLFKDFILFNKENDRRLFNAVHGQKVILVDDFRTSGTTIKEMLRQLSENGASEVVIFVLIKLG